jgi:hypothetical protein
MRWGFEALCMRMETMTSREQTMTLSHWIAGCNGFAISISGLCLLSILFPKKMVVFCICCFPTIAIAFLAYFPLSSTFNRSPAFSIGLQQFQRASSHFISHSSEKNRPPAFSFAFQRKNSHSSKTKWLSSSFILIPAKIFGFQHFHSYSSENIWLPENLSGFQKNKP